MMADPKQSFGIDKQLLKDAWSEEPYPLPSTV
jgi:hypothetical protein